MPANFADQDLHHRSFKRQCLNGADFSGADLRGCNFEAAQLIGANFANASMGQTARQRFVWLSVAIGVALLIGDASLRLIFGSIGQSPDDRSWTYVLVLYAVLSLTGLTMGSWTIAKLPFRLQMLAGQTTGALSGALLGFFQVGSAANNHPSAAIAGAIGGALLGFSLSFWLKRTSVAIGLAAAGTVVTYGATFFIGTTALSFLSVQRFQWGILLSLPTVLYLWLTWRSLRFISWQIRTAIGTSFRGADLTNANFAAVDLRQTDLTQTIVAPTADNRD
jgi:hypothetical protein